MEEDEEGAVCCIFRCMTIWFRMTYLICFFDGVFCLVLSGAVAGSGHKLTGAFFMVFFFLFNIVLRYASSRCPSGPDDFAIVRRLKEYCLLSCSSVMVLLAISFTFITRYHYYELWPRNPQIRNGISFLSIHQMGLIPLVAGIPVLYGCKCQHLRDDKKMIYRMIADVIDIYVMAELLSLGAPSCTPLTPSTTSGPFDDKPTFNCTESTYSALKKGSRMEIAVQVLCSSSFLIFILIYRAALIDPEDKDSIRKHTTIARLLQDIPFFIFRTIVWKVYSFEDQFIFLVKNVVSMCLASLEYCSSHESTDQGNQTTRSSNQRQQGNQTTRSSNQRQQGNQTNDGNTSESAA